MSLRSRINDYRHERHIRFLQRRVHVALDRGDRDVVVSRWAEMVAAINARSPDQVRRIEVRIFADPRTAIKRGLMRSFFCRLVLASVVSWAFRILRLRRF